MASFEGDVGTGQVTAAGDGWSVDVRAVGPGVPVPMLATFGNDQAGGRADVVVRGWGGAGRVHVTATGPTLSGWLGSGTHAGVVGSGRLIVRPARKG
jgi:hypothetical protein